MGYTPSNYPCKTCMGEVVRNLVLRQSLGECHRWTVGPRPTCWMSMQCPVTSTSLTLSTSDSSLNRSMASGVSKGEVTLEASSGDLFRGSLLASTTRLSGVNRKWDKLGGIRVMNVGPQLGLQWENTWAEVCSLLVNFCMEATDSQCLAGHRRYHSATVQNQRLLPNYN